MAQRISYSLLDPWLTLPLKRIYGRLPIPAAFPPEGIVLAGHGFAALAGVGFAFSTRFWWGGLLAAVGVALNHGADVLDGTHARTTQQCRNGGELLDHFLDPLSFTYWLTGIAVSCGRLDLGLVAVVCLYATAVLTNIKAKLTGEFTLARFGPTEFKTLLALYTTVLSLFTLGGMDGGSQFLPPQKMAFWFFSSLIVVGVIQLIVHLVLAVRQVNAGGPPPDTSEWVNRP